MANEPLPDQLCDMELLEPQCSPSVPCDMEPPPYKQGIVLRYRTGEPDQVIELVTYNLQITNGNVEHWRAADGKYRPVCPLLNLIAVEIRRPLVLMWLIESREGLHGTFYWLGRDNWTVDIRAAARFSHEEDMKLVVAALDRPGLLAVNL